MSTVISVENVSKLYRLGEIGTGTLSHDVNRWWHKVRGKEDPYLKIGQVNEREKKAEKLKTETLKEEANGDGPKVISASQRFSVSASSSSDYVYALKDVSFEVKQGEVLGIIGRNGAGKSTLLKILSRVTTPTTGEIKAKGRIASLLEVGTGFHPELSGRDNIYLNGAILGMRKHEIDSKFDEIVDFSGCERYIDTPVKRYSSGMYVRLAFAVAAHLDPEILIVDEVLAVGDAEFQKKCLGKMKDVAGHGRTILFVSHNIGAIMTLCNRTVYLKSGIIKEIGETSKTVHEYLSEGGHQNASINFDLNDPASGDNYIRLLSARILGPTGKPQSTIGIADEACIEIDYEIKNTLASPRVNLHFQADDGEYAFASIQNTPPHTTTGCFRSRMHIPGNFFNGKAYRISIYVSSFQPTQIHVELKDIIVLNVTDDPRSITRQSYTGPFPGVLRPHLNWDLEQI